MSELLKQIIIHWEIVQLWLNLHRELTSQPMLINGKFSMLIKKILNKMYFKYLSLFFSNSNLNIFFVFSKKNKRKSSHLKFKKVLAKMKNLLMLNSQMIFWRQLNQLKFLKEWLIKTLLTRSPKTLNTTKMMLMNSEIKKELSCLFGNSLMKNQRNSVSLVWHGTENMLIYSLSLMDHVILLSSLFWIDYFYNGDFSILRWLFKTIKGFNSFVFA